ncbi:PEPxxWA-CTERM sorting domain-containing protein [Sphingomonas phyllosphaerae]|uniref:PEPxxWA-CTERM sorting domain-containing protein n=1 Tax=Sphingomonas phyllosphaerae TaxID=257003 RepID=UPI0009DB7877|nr:PEPxxWA-CTERM sorting domain-containing protein [Sphingomonas phyllosphaerae]
MMRFIAAAALAGTIVAMPASAAPFFFDFVSKDPAESVSFTLDSDPTPSNVYGTYFQILGVPQKTWAGVSTGRLNFFSGSGQGGFLSEYSGASTAGTVLFSGTLSKPSFIAGTYNLRGFGSSSGGSLTITNLAASVPEPASWMMMILGFGVVGYAMRRKTVLRFV